MSADDTDDDEERDDDPLAPDGEEDPLAPESGPGEAVASEDGPSTRERIEENADRAVESFDEGVIDLLSWLLDTETRARIYVYLRKNPDSTSKEVAKGTGLYPSTVREALAELHDDETVTRQKRQSEGAGNNPYEYAAIPPSDLVGNVVGQIQGELNAVFNLDDHLSGEEPDDDGGAEPVTITVRDESDDENGDDGDDE